MSHVQQFYQERKKALKIPGSKFWLKISLRKNGNIDLILLDPLSDKEHQGLTDISMDTAGRVCDRLFAH